jgi:threonine synthase
MMYYSTNGKAPEATLRKAVVNGLAEDRGLYMPRRIPRLPDRFFEDMAQMSFQELSCAVADAFFGEDIPADDLHRIVQETLSFDCPTYQIEENIWVLELFHGPTLAFKDVGARFMARLLAYFSDNSPVNVLVATSGDTGSAVANGFLGVEGVRVFVLYPKGKVSPIQECQFTTLGQNITALEIDGCFDDCQALVKNAFMDADLRAKMKLTSANSINVARFLPQSFYYFNAVARLRRAGISEAPVICVPSGNFGNLCAALFAAEMGLPVKRFIAANNSNRVFYDFLQDGQYRPRPSIQTLANAMDVGDPSNFARIWELYGRDAYAVRAHISGAVVDDKTIERTILECYSDTGYLLDPHGACGYRALKDGLRDGEKGIFCETAHPAKFLEKMEEITALEIDVPQRLAAFMKGTKQSVPLGKDYEGFRDFLVSSI